MHVERVGKGPPVLLLHGFTGSTRSWDEVRDKLFQHFTVLTVDLPGHGRSPAPDDPAAYGLSRFADDLARMLGAAGVDRVAVVGYSMGGRAALRFALSYPDRCTALVLESTSPGIVDESERAARRKADEELATLLETEGIEAFVDRWEQLPLWSYREALLRRLHPIPAHKLRMALMHVHAQRLAQSPKGLANSLRGAGAGVEPPVVELLSSLRMPVLLLAGALDEKYVAHARVMEAHIPDATVYVDPDSGHALHLEIPTRVASVIHRFLMSKSR